ncbi:unnamed protein product, partial [Amoebophrya sp. A25]
AKAQAVNAETQAAATGEAPGPGDGTNETPAGAGAESGEKSQDDKQVDGSGEGSNSTSASGSTEQTSTSASGTEEAKTSSDSSALPEETPDEKLDRLDADAERSLHSRSDAGETGEALANAKREVLLGDESGLRATGETVFPPLKLNRLIDSVLFQLSERDNLMGHRRGRPAYVDKATDNGIPEAWRDNNDYGGKTDATATAEQQAPPSDHVGENAAPDDEKIPQENNDAG